MKKAVFLFLFGLTSLTGSTQLRLRYDGNRIDLSNTPISYRFDTSFLIEHYHSSNDQAYQWMPLKNEQLRLNRLSQSIWLKIPIKSIASSYGAFKYLNVDNPHINFLACAIYNQHGMIKKFNLTGDNLPFSSRSIPVTSFDFSINSNELTDAYIILIADKKYTNLSLPINFCSENYYLESNEKKKIAIGLIIGNCVFILFLNFFLYLVIKQNLFLWYGLFLSFILIYILSDNGILFKFLYPNFPPINDLIRPFTLAISIIPLILFFNKLIDFKQFFPKIHLLNKGILMLYIPLFITAAISTSSGNFQLQGAWLQVNRILSPLLMLTLLSESIYCFYKAARYSFFPLLSFVGTTGFVIIYSLHQNALIPDNWYNANSIYLAIIWEFLAMSLALVWRYKYYKMESELLFQKTQNQQEIILIETATFQEKEMQRISSILHDTVGANLGLLRIEADNMPLTNEGRVRLANQITQLGNEVRILSHNFSPIILQENGLFIAVEELINRVRTNSELTIQFEWIGEKKQIKPQFEIIMYRIIQEMIQNIMKHSNNQNAFLQILVEQDLISIYSENELSRNTKKNNDHGVGLKSIEKLMSLLDGSFKVICNEEEGFSISIEFNQNPHEKI